MKADGNVEMPPPLRMPGWAVRVYVEIHNQDGDDALQTAVLGLLRAGVPGAAGSLARELCIEESIVNSVLKDLADMRLIVPDTDGLSWRAGGPSDPYLQDVFRRMGWVFWDSLRKRLLPELLLDDSGRGLRSLATNGGKNDELAASSFEKPSIGEIRNELMPVLEGSDISIRDFDEKNQSSENECMTVANVRRISLHESRGWLRWHPLMVPYQIQTYLGTSASIYCNEPVYSEQLAEVSPYSPFLRPIIEASLPDSYAMVRKFADRMQSEELRRHGAFFLEPYGGTERVMGEARDEVIRLLGGRIPPGPFGSDELVQAASEAECDRLITAKLERSERSHRASYSAILQILGKLMADEMAHEWRDSPSATRLAQLYPESRFCRSRHNREEMLSQWSRFVREFDERHGLRISEWNIGTPGDHLSKAQRDWPLSQLGTVLRSWGALAVVAEHEPAGGFFLHWIKGSIRAFPELFQTFERLKEQRNVDKNSISVGVPLEAYRSDLYRIWRALSIGYQEAGKH